MSIIGAKGGASAVYEIGHSLRLRASASASLSTTGFTSGGTPIKLTFSTRIKRGSLGYQGLLGTYSDANNIGAFYINANDRLQFYNWQSGAYTVNKESTAVFRDLSAHYHFVLIVDTTLATAEDRFQIWVNGVRITSWTTNTNTHSQNTGVILGYAAGGVTQRIGVNPDGTTFSNAYFSDIHYLWANKAAASDFGQLDENGVWVPKKPTGITYGAYGAHLDFSNGSSTTTLGYDKNGVNNWTCNNVSLTAGATYDWMTDTPTNNFCTLNPLWSNLASNLADGALRHNGVPVSEGRPRTGGTIAVNSGKWYWEQVHFAGTAGTAYQGGVAKTSVAPVNIAAGSAGTTMIYSLSTGSNSTSYDGSTIDKTLVGVFAANDVLQVAVDFDTGKIWYGKNGTWLKASGDSTPDPAAGLIPAATFTVGSDLWSPVVSFPDGWGGGHINFGQRPFSYTPPSGFKALCTANLPAVSVAKPALHFDTKLDTGANIKTTAEAVYASFMEWIKDRANINNHQLIDSVRGSSAVLQSNTTGAETTYSAPSGNSVAWVWKANGSGVSNTDGSITSTVSANQAAGFSIVTYTGNGSTGTVGHGLGITPSLIIVKGRSGTGRNWMVEVGKTNADRYLMLNSTAAYTLDSTPWNNTNPTSSTFAIGANANTNQASETFVAYCFAEIPGYSKFGSYTGNGSAEGPFVWCGFRPRYVLIKRTDAAPNNWVIYDTARESYNAGGASIAANLADAETASSADQDIVSNGFKLRTTGSGRNANNGTYIFAAFAEHPFGGANVSPTPAR